MRDEWVNWLEPVRALAAEASEQILEIYATAFGVTAKDDDSPLTAADLAAHHVIVAGLQKLTPDIPVLSEESAAVPFAERSKWRRYWLVDPLDGTKEFVQRNGQFTVNIALIEEHEPVLGVVRVPVTGVCYSAARGDGAFREEPGQPPQPITVKPLRLGEPVRVVGSKSHGGPGCNNSSPSWGRMNWSPSAVRSNSARWRKARRTCIHGLARPRNGIPPPRKPSSKWPAVGWCRRRPANHCATTPANRC
jgi:3'(2'),5'-bisphosphate nucleotidase